jgi:hypothetical protein
VAGQLHVTQQRLVERREQRQNFFTC